MHRDSSSPISLQHIFGMNVSEINTGTRGSLHIYFAFAVPLTLFTAWILGAMLYRPTSSNENERAGNGAGADNLYGRELGQRTFFWQRVGWPVVVVWRLVKGVWKSRDTSTTKSG